MFWPDTRTQLDCTLSAKIIRDRGQQIQYKGNCEIGEKLQAMQVTAFPVARFQLRWLSCIMNSCGGAEILLNKGGRSSRGTHTMSLAWDSVCNLSSLNLQDKSNLSHLTGPILMSIQFQLLACFFHGSINHLQHIACPASSFWNQFK